MIERCLFVICLDKVVNYDPAPQSPKLNGNSQQAHKENGVNDMIIFQSMTPIAFQMLHGCSSKNNSGNRWFDKTMQFIISEDGYCGLNYEHSPAEGIVVIELSEHLFRYMDEKRKQKLQRIPSICELPTPRKLRWKISEPVNEWIELAKAKLDRSIEDLDLCVLKYSKFGREFPKKVKMSPDSFIQISMQLAYYK